MEENQPITKTPASLLVCPNHSKLNLRLYNASLLAGKNSSSNISSSTQNVSLPLLNITKSPDPDDSHSIMVFNLLLIVISLTLLWYPLKIWWNRRNIRLSLDPTSPIAHLPLPPGSFGLPLIGETFAWITQGSKFNASRRSKYGNVFKTNTIGQPMVRVTGHEFVGEVLRGEHDKVTTIWPVNVRKILGENVLVNSMGDVHRHKRKIACKAFTMTALRSYVPSMVKHARRHIQSLGEMERPLVYNKVLRLTFDVAASTLLGLDMERSDSQDLVNAFYDMVNNIFCIPLMIPKLGFSTAMGARAKILVLLQDHMREKKEKLLRKMTHEDEDVEERDECRPAFDIIIREMLKDEKRVKEQNGGPANANEDPKTPPSTNSEECSISDLALKEIAMELMFAGYFTSGSALTSCILELSRHPDVFEKVEDELVEHGFLKDEKSKGDPDVEATPESIHALTYLEQVLKETLRVRPPVLGGYRRAKKTFQLGNYRVPKGWTVIYNIRDTHDFEYEGMDTFDPERFSPENRSNDKFKFIPFGGGPRTCIGREYARLLIKLSLIEMFRHYHSWELEGNKLPKMRAIPTLHPTNGLPCIFHPRQKVGFVSR